MNSMAVCCMQTISCLPANTIDVSLIIDGQPIPSAAAGKTAVLALVCRPAESALLAYWYSVTGTVHYCGFILCVAEISCRPDGRRRERVGDDKESNSCLLYTSPSPRD